MAKSIGIYRSSDDTIPLYQTIILGEEISYDDVSRFLSRKETKDAVMKARFPMSLLVECISLRRVYNHLKFMDDKVIYVFKHINLVGNEVKHRTEEVMVTAKLTDTGEDIDFSL